MEPCKICGSRRFPHTQEQCFAISRMTGRRSRRVFFGVLAGVGVSAFIPDLIKQSIPLPHKEFDKFFYMITSKEWANQKLDPLPAKPISELISICSRRYPEEPRAEWMVRDTAIHAKDIATVVSVSEVRCGIQRSPTFWNRLS